MKSICEALIEELKTKPSLAKKLAEILAPYFPEILKILRKMVDEMSFLRQDFNKMLARLEALEKRHAEDTNKIFTILRGILDELASHRKVLDAHSKLLEEHSKVLREHSRILKEHSKILKKHSELLERHSELLRQLMKMSVRIEASLSHAFEAFAREVVEGYLKDLKVIPKDAKLKAKRFNGGFEINMFLENPLILGEVTSAVFKLREVEDMINKICEAEKIVKRKPKEKVIMIFLVVGKDLADKIKQLCKEKGIRLFIGKVIE